VVQAFDISMGVRRDDRARRDRLNRFIKERRGDIDAILAEYHVPRTER
jgi:mxaJ protein